MELEKLKIYKMSRDLSRLVWDIYDAMNIENKILIGKQVVRSTDSIGANIAEGYGRYHYLDSVKFYYNARASHYEAIAHWLSLLYERCIVNNEEYQEILKISNELAPKLNSFISSTYNAKKNIQISNF